MARGLDIAQHVSASLSPIEKEVLRLRKTLRQICSLEERVAAGDRLQRNQLDKIGTKADVERQLMDMQGLDKKQRPSCEADIKLRTEALPEPVTCTVSAEAKEVRKLRK